MTAGPQSSDSRVKILAIIEASKVTGPAKNLLTFATEAANHACRDLPKINTTIATFRRGPYSGENDFLAAAAIAGIDSEYLDERRRFDFGVLTMLRDCVQRHDPAIIQTHSVKAHFLARLSGICRERPWVAFHHGYTTTDLKMRAYNKLDRWSLRAASRVITVSQEFARDLAKSGVNRERITVVHNAVEKELFEQADKERADSIRAQLGIGNNGSIIVAAGRFSREKGFVDLVAAFAELHRMHPEVDCKLVLAGDGPERGNIATAARSLGVDDRVVFAGYIEDIRALFSIGDVLAIPSHSEGSPNVLLEAMAFGIPVVAANVGGIPEIVEDEASAILVKPGDRSAMAHGLAKVLTDGALSARIAAAAREKATTHHTIEARTRSLIQIYKEVISLRPVRAYEDPELAGVAIPETLFKGQTEAKGERARQAF